MTPQKKQEADWILTFAHKLVTLIGIPIIIAIVGDMYFDFKQMRSNDIRQDEKIQRTREDLNETKQNLQSLGIYVYRGIK